jgi:hypothetical protein
MDKNKEELLKKHTLMDCENEIIYCKQILDGSANEAEKKRVRDRIEEVKQMKNQILLR